MIEFRGFNKIARLNREVIVTEKIDGTNGVIWVGDDSTEMLVGSRSQWITTENDNFGFARWAVDHKAELLTLGPGYHYGEWWGAGIQRRYGLTDKRWSLFNVHRWSESRPACCHIVPVLARGVDIRLQTEKALQTLRDFGSSAAPGFMKPEGVVIFHTAASALFKVTLEKDEAPKSKPSGDAEDGGWK